METRPEDSRSDEPATDILAPDAGRQPALEPRSEPEPDAPDVPDDFDAPGSAGEALAESGPQEQPEPEPVVGAGSASNGEPEPEPPAQADSAPREQHELQPISLAGSESHTARWPTPIRTGSPAVAEPFRLFYAQYGPTLCGAPISELEVVDGLPSQYFERIALEVHQPGRVRLKALGAAWLKARAEGLVDAGHDGLREPGAIVELRAVLPRHAVRTYDTRPLAQIRYLVLHHTGAAADLSPEEIAREHVEANGWPGIGYHYVIDRRGTIYRTQDLTTVSYHARQFNPVAVGIAISGDFTSSVPGGDQLDAAARLLADLRQELGLPSTCIRGHREIVATPCPGDAFLTLWKPRLERLVERNLIWGARVPAALP